ncbi:UDP-glycosyltransferase 90A1-like [Impatiens glandulifera]|uniref:UDP-glycosyltransferase 90A1-like n=1 Tax=Impatiens glandulifera TaxID=253017 RepID=UPI001FB158AA|nr:UDP-glycosyltransferase 90A1-like [Impatiens glandulifera]
MTSHHHHHIVLFPFMAKGHTIPLLHLARLLIHRHVTITFITTPANRPFIAEYLAGAGAGAASILVLPFPNNIPEIPPGVESTDQLPSPSLFLTFAKSTKLLRPDFESALESLPHVSCIISDGFLGWTLDSAAKFGIPRLVSFGMSNYTMSITEDVMANRLLVLTGPETDNDDEPITLTSFPWIKLTRNDFDQPFNQRQPNEPLLEFINEQISSTSASFGSIMNSFYELEPAFVNYMNRDQIIPKAWCVGPLCLAEPSSRRSDHDYLDWLDQKLAEGRSILYVAFGSQTDISTEQLTEIALGLEQSGVNFIWVWRKGQEGDLGGFEERVKDRGIVKKGWVDQKAILGHESVKGFLSHCGWNSIIESVCAKVPILAWPMFSDQHLNARMVVEESKIGLRVETVNGSVRGFVNSKGLEKMVREMMEGEKGKEVRKKVSELGEAARMAMEEGGSSWNALNRLLHEVENISS